MSFSQLCTRLSVSFELNEWKEMTQSTSNLTLIFKAATQPSYFLVLFLWFQIHWLLFLAGRSLSVSCSSISNIKYTQIKILKHIHKTVCAFYILTLCQCIRTLFWLSTCTDTPKLGLYCRQCACRPNSLAQTLESNKLWISFCLDFLDQNCS